MSHPNPLFEAALPHVRAWLAGCLRHSDDAIAFTGDYALWDYQRDALGHGTLEMINDPALTLSPNLLALSLELELPPIRSAEDAYALLTLADTLDGAAVVAKGANEALAVQLKVPLAEVSADTLPVLYRRLAAAKRYLEEP